jgi:DNA-directed RNA polymerase specialized sigma54-like protein
MLPNVPVSVWEQIAVIVVFAFLLAGLGWILVKIFTGAIADVNAHYANLLKDTNMQWQKYFDARAEASNSLAEKLTVRMDEIAHILSVLVSDFEKHDRVEMKLIEAMRIAQIERKKNRNV